MVLSSQSAQVRLGEASGRWVLLATVLGSALAGIDATVVNIALPTIGRELHGGFSSLQWAVNAYTLTLASFILLGGALGDRYGRRRVFLVGVIWFALASALVAALTVGPLIGALAGHFWALVAIGALFSAAVALTTFGLETLLGLAGTGIAAFVLILVGNSTAGGASSQEFLPDVFRQVAQVLPNGAAVSFVRNTVYFSGNDTNGALVVIALWAACGLALVLVAVPLRSRLGRAEKIFESSSHGAGPRADAPA